MNTHEMVDPARPWIRDPRDDLRQMRWIETLFNPMGETVKSHFTRAWTLMFMGRLLTYFIPVLVVSILALAGLEAGVLTKPTTLGVIAFPTMLLPFVAFALLTEFTSLVAHMRRLAEAKRPTWLAVIVLVPLVLAMMGFLGGTMMGKQAYQMRQDYVAAKETLKAEPENKEAKRIVAQGRQRGMERMLIMERRRNIEPPTELKMAAGMGQRIAIMVWALASLPVMLWTLFYVARLPTGGRGRLYSGSEELPDEFEAAGSA
ncbi:MAG: hypothetical protein ACRBEQ_05050 [Hyphomonas sp.]